MIPGRFRRARAEKGRRPPPRKVQARSRRRESLSERDYYEILGVSRNASTKS
jgi:hypothetical protein